MKEEEIYSAINKGIPNQIKLELPTSELIAYCSENKRELDKSISNIRKMYENAIASITWYNKSNHEFFNNLRLVTNYKNSSTDIYVSPICFLKRLKEILGVVNESLDINDEELLKEFNTSLKTLDSINDIDKLKEEFPIIFADYKYALNLSDLIRSVEKINPGSMDEIRLDYQKNGLDTRFRVFLSNQKMMYHSFIDNAKKIFDYANSNPVTLDVYKSLDKDKFELFIANKYLEYARKINDDNYKQLAIYYITTYLNESCGKVIKMYYKNKELSNISLLKDFKGFLKANRHLKPVNESRKVYEEYHIKHVKNHINKYLNGLNNWCVVRTDAKGVLLNQQARLEKMADYNMNNKEENRDNRHKIIEKYMSMLFRKLNFYENSNYELRLFGIGPFDSHIAYFYPNGIVVVDKLYYESLDIDPTYNEAIYIMDTSTFLNMNMMDKPSLRENDNVKRIFHSGYWEDRLQKEIDNPTINTNKEDVKLLINKYSSKKVFK